MGKLGKEAKTLLIAITAICLVSFLLSGGIATLLANNFQQELLLWNSWALRLATP